MAKSWQYTGIYYGTKEINNKKTHGKKNLVKSQQKYSCQIKISILIYKHYAYMY